MKRQLYKGSQREEDVRDGFEAPVPTDWDLEE